MSVNSLIRDGIIHKFNYPVHVWDLKEGEGWHHNPSICRDDTGRVWLSKRHHDKLPLIVHLSPKDLDPKIRDEASRLVVGFLNEKTLEVTGQKLITPEEGSPSYIFNKNIEDCRIFWRPDGLHGIGVAINDSDHKFKITQIEILIDYEKATYKLLRDYGQPHDHVEKNWRAPAVPARAFDFIYSPNEIVLDGKVYGEEYDGFTHGGSQLLPYKDGWISIVHQVVPVRGVTARWYATFAELHDYLGKVTHVSQFFDFGSGWRENLQESVEFVSGAIWSKGKEEKELLLSLGVRDETCGFVRVPTSVFKWNPIEDVIYYNFVFGGNHIKEPDLSRIEPIATTISGEPVLAK